jgi:Ni/Co efflux regulator RcnB
MKEHTMRYRKFAVTVVALAVGASGAAFGQGNPRPEDFPQYLQGSDKQIRDQGGIARASQLPPQRGQVDQRGVDRNYRGDPRDGYQGNARNYQRDGYQGDSRDYQRDYQRDYHRGDQSYYQGNGYRGDGRYRGAGPSHSWYRGDRLPPEYRGRYYVVDDWRGHHLSAPPRGYHWVQAGNDYVLAAIATGVIAAILLNQ